MAAAAGSAAPKRGKSSGGAAGGRAQPVTPAKRAQVLKLHAEGMGRNKIALEVGISGASVTKIIKAAGESFDTTATATATEVRMVDLKAKRAQLSELLLNDAFRLREHAWTMRESREEDADGVLKAMHLEERNGREMKDLYLATAIAVDKHLAIVKVDSDDRDLPAVDAWLVAMMGGTK